MSKIKLAVIGCGAVSERCHLPAAKSVEGCELSILIDRDTDRARTLAKKFSVRDVSSDYKDALKFADAALIALPHSLHAKVAIDLLIHGMHVLVEKPMAMNSAECRAMIDASKQGNAVLAVGLIRRFLHSTTFIKEILHSGALGRALSFDFSEGNVYNWPVTTDSFFRPEISGGGVLFDTGAHTLDLLCWWLGDMEVLDYVDDSFGGVEADCRIRLRSTESAEGMIELSRTRNLRNTAIIMCERGDIEADLRKNTVTLNINKTGISGHGINMHSPSKGSGQGFADLFKPQIEDFVNSIITGVSPRASGDEGARSVELIDRCYKQRKKLILPWIDKGLMEASPFKGKTVLVTGATGFIGGRLIEMLYTQHGAKIRALVRNYKNASRIARFPIETINADIIDEQKVMKAVEDCDYIFHCAYDFAGNAAHKRQVSVDGTEYICKAALKNGSRLVHVSTISVYGPTLDGDLNEETPKVSTDDIYTLTKLAAEEMVLLFCKKGLKASIVQPTIVYGPYSRPWTINIIKQMQDGLVVLPDGGDGLCNAVYIDDVIEGMLLSAISDKAVGEAFLLSGSNPITWREFYGAFEGLLDRQGTVSMSSNEIDGQIKSKTSSIKKKGTIGEIIAVFKDQSLWERVYNISGVNSKAQWMSTKFPRVYDYAISKALGLKRYNEPQINLMSQKESGAKIILPDRTRFELLRSKTNVKIEKAKKVLGYEPTYDIQKGMKITADFMKWGGLV